MYSLGFGTDKAARTFHLAQPGKLPDRKFLGSVVNVFIVRNQIFSGVAGESYTTIN